MKSAGFRSFSTLPGWRDGTALHRRAWVLRLLCMDGHPVNLDKSADWQILQSEYSCELFAPFTELRIQCHLSREERNLKIRKLNSKKNMQRF